MFHFCLPILLLLENVNDRQDEEVSIQESNHHRQDLENSVLMRKIMENWFMLSSLIMISLAIAFSFIIPREEIHMAINKMHTPFLDELFIMWTWLGDGTGALIIVCAALLIKIRYSLILFAGYSISGLSVQLLKRTLFSETARPVKYFELHGITYDHYLVPGVDLHSWYSFPSGHSATAFGVFFGLSLILRSRVLQLISFMLATGVGFSRIYLSQHFLMDVTAGACIGMVSGYLGWWWICRYERKWLNISLQNLLIK